MAQQTFGEWISERRRALHLKGAECAERIGVTPQAWSDWESDRTRRQGEQPRRPRAETVRKIADALEVPYEEALQAAGYLDDGDAGNATDPDQVALGRRLRERREAMGYSATDVARILGLTQVAYSYYETGERAISVTNLKRAARFLRTSVAALVGELDAVHAEEEELLAFYRGAPPELRAAQRAALKGIFDLADRSETTHGKKAS